MAVSFLVLMSFADVNKVIFVQRDRLEKNVDLREKFLTLANLLSESAEVDEILRYSYHQNMSSGSTKCLFDPSMEAMCDEKESWDSATPLRVFVPPRDGDGRFIPPESVESLSTLAFVEDPAANHRNGFTKTGAICTDFDPVSGNDRCPFRFVVKWRPICSGSVTSCRRPDFAEVKVELQVKPQTLSLDINPQNYSLVVSVAKKSKKVVALGAGSDLTTCAIYEDTTARCWGSNGYGGLGANLEGANVSPRSRYVKDFSGSRPLTGIKKIVDGQATLCALVQQEGMSRVTCWGENQHGGVGLGVRGPQHGPGAEGLEFYTHPRGWVVGPTGEGYLEDVEDIWGGEHSICAQVKSETGDIGKIYCWGDLHWSAPVCIPNRNAGSDVGQYSFSAPSTYFPPFDLINSVSSTYPYWTGSPAGVSPLEASQHVYFQSIPTEIEAVDPGSPDSALLGILPGSLDPVRGCNMISRGEIKKFHHGRITGCFIVGEDQQLNCWGANGTYGKSQLTSSTVFTKIHLNSTHRIPAPGSGRYTNINQVWNSTPPFEPLKNVVDVNMSGLMTAYAVLKDGRVVSWGEDRNFNPWEPDGRGMMGRGAEVTEAWSTASYQDIAPGFVKKIEDGVLSDLTGIKRVVGGRYHACALSDLGELWCWGANKQGQLGAGLPFWTFSPAAVKVQLAEPFKDFTVGKYQTCGLTVSGSVYCWGCTGYGEIGVDRFGVAPHWSETGWKNTPMLVGLLDQEEGP